MSILERIGKELGLSKDQLIKEGIYHFLEFELRNLNAELAKIYAKYGVRSFDDLWKKLEDGVIFESECFDDLTRLEYLELRVEKVRGQRPVRGAQMNSREELYGRLARIAVVGFSDIIQGTRKSRESSSPSNRWQLH